MSSVDSRVPVKPGDLLANKYLVERVIGVGGMGVVVAALHVTLNQRVALKLMLPDAAANAESVQRFIREARAAAQLRSDHVARVLDVGTLDGGEPFMVMELLLGSDLEEVVRRREVLPIREAVDYVRQACDALAEAHQRGIVHRDLKPGNLFLATDARGRTQIKVLDFGISKSTALEGTLGNLALTKTAAVMGSPLYMSPEQMRATRNVDARTDIWSLGVTLYQLIVGRVPFFAESPMELGAKVLHEAPVPPEVLRPEIPPALSAVIMRCLAKEPAQRFATPTELAHALEQSLANVEIPAGTRVLVSTRSPADGGPALPYSHTALAHSATGMPQSATRRRPVLFVVIAVAAAATVAVAIRVQPHDPLPPAAATDVTAKGDQASIDVDATPRALDLPKPEAAAPATAQINPSNSAPPIASASPPARTRPTPPRRDRAQPHVSVPTTPPREPGSAADVTPVPPVPAANPLDHM